VEDDVYSNSNSVKLGQTVKNSLMCIKNKKREEMLVYASLHGNNTAILSNVIDYLNKRGSFDGFAIGGLSNHRSDLRRLIDTIVCVKSKIGDKPLHVFGIGGPSYIPLLVYLGVDTFDSSSFMTAGSNRTFFIPDEGSYKFNQFDNLEYPPCICPICSKNKIDVVRSQRKLIALHNLWTINYEIRKLKMNIIDNSLEEYLDHRFYFNPVIKNAFSYAKIKMRKLT
jgi:tRNA-guanine family transglycosylase